MMSTAHGGSHSARANRHPHFAALTTQRAQPFPGTLLSLDRSSPLLRRTSGVLPHGSFLRTNAVRNWQWMPTWKRCALNRDRTLRNSPTTCSCGKIFPIGEIKEAAGPRVFYYPSPTDLSTGQELVMCSYPYPFDKAAVCTESALVAPTVLYR